MGKAKYKELMKADSRRFVGIPYDVMSNQKYISLTDKAKVLLFDLAFQYNGSNNGNLTACFTVMKKRGWSSATLDRARRELLHTGYIVVSRQGMKVRGKPTLLALTFKKIDPPPEGLNYDHGIKPKKTHSERLDYWARDKSSWEVQPTVKPP